MDTQTISETLIGRLFIRILAAGMESRFRYRFFNPVNILKMANIFPGQIVLEVGCGTGYFTLPAAKLIGSQGQLIAIDILADSVELVSTKVKTAGLENVLVLKRNAMETGLDTAYFDTVLLFGVIPAPMLALNKLLPEMHRIMKSNGTLSVWPPVPGLLPGSIIKSGLFTFTSERKGVHNFKRC